ncbi:MAG: hypothetical protein ABI960_01740, partial [Candidatus Eisenbacteria bacterium]
VLSTTELREMIESAREAEAVAAPAALVRPDAPAPETRAPAPRTSAVVLAVLFGFLAGYGVGNWVPAALWQRALEPVTALVTPAGH